MGMRGKHIILGVTGGIAAYKSAFLVRELTTRGAVVKVVMTRNAQQFITPLTFQVLSGEEVVTDTFQETAGGVLHVALAEWADLVIVAPATANCIAKAAHGIADDFLSTFMLAVRAPVLLCPAMNSNMLTHPAVQHNLDLLRSRGYAVLSAHEGELACGVQGPGRLAEVADIVDEADSLIRPKDLRGVRFLITASRTEEYLDPVRCLTNRSSGKMGFALSIAARQRGGEVCLVTGPSDEPDPREVKTIRVVSAGDMREAVVGEFPRCQVVIKAAAVSDFRPVGERKRHKIKRVETLHDLVLEENPDILRELGAMKEHQCLVGFAAETRTLIENASEKIRTKNLDFIVANNVSEEGCGFRCDTNKVKIIYRDGRVDDVPKMDKLEVAHAILDRVRDWLGEKPLSH